MKEAKKSNCTYEKKYLKNDKYNANDLILCKKITLHCQLLANRNVAIF